MPRHHFRDVLVCGNDTQQSGKERNGFDVHPDYADQ